jgi:Bacterial archaeo-eukaryotic release factor family 2
MKTSSLASLFDDPGPFASAYVEVSKEQEAGNRVADLNVREVCDSLRDQGAPAEVVSQVEACLSESHGEPAPVSRCCVVTERGVLLNELTRTHRAHPISTWGPLPDIAAFAGDVGRQVPFVLAVVDHEGGDVSTYATNVRLPDHEASVGEPSTWEHKTGRGGWSELRWQHSAEGVWKRNANEVAEEIVRQVRTGPDLVILAGNEKSRRLVQDQLPDSLRAELVVLDRAGRSEDGGDEALTAEIEHVLRDRVITSQLADVHELRDRMGQGDRVALGIRDVADAFVRGQVARLLIDPAAAAEFTLRLEDHPGLTLGAIQATGELRADQALVAAACLTGAELVIATAGTLGGAPVAAILRWD